MTSAMECITPRAIIRSLACTFGFNSIIAVFLSAIKFGDGFFANFVFSQCIGLSICSCVLTALHRFQVSRLIVQVSVVAAALPLGTLIGVFSGAVITGLSFSELFDRHNLFELLILGIMFGSIITYIFGSRAQIAESTARIQEEKIKRLTSEKKVVEADLKLLQAQIEPHFLFNTLSNVLSLLDTDTDKGKSMLIDFIHYLRTSLSKFREETVTLGQEMELIRAYLNIYKVRFGARLNYQISLPEDLADFSVPPMLLQPLVENAIKHGLEPSIDGGEIWIGGTKMDGVIRLEVVNTGMGFSDNGESGVGLTNVRDRLNALYGDRGRLILEDNQPSGLKATIEVPYGRP